MYKLLASRKTANFLIAAIFLLVFFQQIVFKPETGLADVLQRTTGVLLGIAAGLLVLSILLCTGQRKWGRLKQKDYKYQGAVQLDEAQLVLVKNKFKFTGQAKDGGFRNSSVIFHLSLIGLLAGLLASYLFGFYGRMIITEGQILPQQPGSYQTVKKGPLAGNPQAGYSFGLGPVVVRYRNGMAEPTDFSAQLIMMQNHNITAFTELKPNSSFDYQGVNISLEDFGLAPKVQIISADGKKEETYVNLIWETADDILYIGRDVVDIPDTGLRISLKVYPDAKFLPDGTLKTLSNELRAPAVWAEVYSKDSMVFRGPALPGQKMRCSNGMAVVVPEIRKWVTLVIKKDYGYNLTLIFAVIALISLGAAVLFPPFRLELTENQLLWFADKHPHLLLDRLQSIVLDDQQADHPDQKQSGPDQDRSDADQPKSDTPDRQRFDTLDRQQS